MFRKWFAVLFFVLPGRHAVYRGVLKQIDEIVRQPVVVPELFLIMLVYTVWFEL